MILKIKDFKGDNMDVDKADDLQTEIDCLSADQDEIMEQLKLIVKQQHTIIQFLNELRVRAGQGVMAVDQQMAEASETASGIARIQEQAARGLEKAMAPINYAPTADQLRELCKEMGLDPNIVRDNDELQAIKEAQHDRHMNIYRGQYGTKP